MPPAVSEPLALRVLREGRGMIGVRWRHMGRSDAGIDCIGLLLVAATRAGVMLPDPAPYTRTPQDQTMREALHAHFQHVGLGDVQPGDILLFNMGLYAGHVGLAGTHPAYGVPSVVHAHLPRRAVIEEARAPFDAYLTGVFRFVEP